VLLGLPSNEKNSFDHHNSYNKGPNLVFFSFTKSPSNFLLTKKIPKKSYPNNMPKTTKAKIWPLRTLGIKSATFQTYPNKFYPKRIYLGDSIEESNYMGRIQNLRCLT
jgi:hypothetical protein